MKTLTIALCLLLVVPPAGAQQVAAARAPNFYVPYGVRDVPVNAVDLESSSSTEMRMPDSGPRRNEPLPQSYPMRRDRYHPLRPAYGPRSQQQESTAMAVVGAAIAAALLIALATGDH